MGRSRGTVLPKAPLAKILGSGGLRVSQEAVDLLCEILEEKGADIAARATEIAKHAKRRTINAGDVKLAKQ